VIEAFIFIASLAPPAEGAPPEALRRLFSLWLVLFLLGLLVLLIALALLAGRHRRRLRAGSARQRAIKDAWVEAGRRMPTPPAMGGGDVTDEERS
jgi:hypothetical protein